MTVTTLRAPRKADVIASMEVGAPMATSETFETYRSYLFSIAYRMLGSVMDAEDMVQETYLRYQSASPAGLLSLKAYLTTIISRLCIDQLQRAYRQRETYLGPWLPEPIVTAGGAGSDVEENTLMRESLSIAFLTMLERLQPLERAVFLLREVFDYDYPEIAGFVDRKQAACRQIFSRARKRLAEERQKASPAPEDGRRLLQAYLEAVRAGDGERLMDILAEDITLIADGGGKVAGAALYPVVGREEVARFSLGASRRFLPPTYDIEFTEINHQPAAIARAQGRAIVVMTVEVEDGRVQTARFLANPDKLRHLQS